MEARGGQTVTTLVSFTFSHQLILAWPQHSPLHTPVATQGMRKRYGEPGLGYGGARRLGSTAASSRFNTFSGRTARSARSASSSRVPGCPAPASYRERTKSAPPPLRRMRSKSEDSSQRRRWSESPWRERRTQTSFSHCPARPSSDQTYPASALASSRRSRRHRGVAETESVNNYTRKAQSFMEKRFLPT